MTELSPRARALIEAARHEELPSAAQIGRVRRSVLRGVAATGSAVGIVSTTSFGAKAAVLGSGITAQVAAYTLAGALAGGAVLAVHAQVTRDDRPRAAVTTPSMARPQPRAPVASAVPQEIHPSTPDNALPDNAMTLVPPAGTLAPIATAPSAVPVPTAASTAAPTFRSPIAAPTTETATQRESAASAANEMTSPEREPAAGVVSEASTPKQGAPGDLVRQLQLLHGMRVALLSGNARHVLELAREGEALFAGSALEAESRAARIAALCQLGRMAEVRREIERFRTAFPRSALLRGVETACPGAVPGAHGR